MGAHLPCSSVAVGLDIEEHTALAAGGQGGRRVHGTRVQSRLAYTLRARQTQVVVHIPSSGPTTFHTPLVRTDWTLRFAFSILAPRGQGSRRAWDHLAHADGGEARALALALNLNRIRIRNAVAPSFRVGPYADEAFSDLKLEVLEWETPLRVLGSRNAAAHAFNPKANGEPNPSTNPNNPKPNPKASSSELEALSRHTGVPARVLREVDVLHQERRLQNNPTLEDDLEALKRRPPSSLVALGLALDSPRPSENVEEAGLGLGVAAQRQVLAGLEVARSYVV
mmetsp:Transcript_22049/g.67713  ORF Transcript_22049/g.67713 Transcript_22049/m.67713 type:complete len:282 (-) Transcript_22049:1418-2263(-)